MVKKKDGFQRMCVDYCRADAATKFDLILLPCIDRALVAVDKLSEVVLLIMR